MPYLLCLWMLLCLLPASGQAQVTYRVSENDKTLVVTSGGQAYAFRGDFTILYSGQDPGLAMRPIEIEGTSYNVPTWKAYTGQGADLKQVRVDASVGGDGFDDRILKGGQENRSPNVFKAGQLISMRPVAVVHSKEKLVFRYPAHALFELQAEVDLGGQGHPALTYTFKPKKAGYFSLGYTGAPAFPPAQAREIWQPLIWQEKRFPDNSYLTTAHMSPLPSALVHAGSSTLGVLAAPQYLPFQPLPLFTNSQFGISVRSIDGLAKPQVFSPVMGGAGSRMAEGAVYRFSVYLVVEPRSITGTYEQLARQYFGFRDYRSNAISTLNKTLDNMVSYSLSDKTWFVDSLKGYSYSTDVPGAVKNVSSLNPLGLALAMDNQEMFEKRAYPLMEYMLSREKFLFALDSTQKIQSPSRKMNGPVAPVSELVTLYRVFNKANPLLVGLARQEYHKTRRRNLEEEEKGANWITAMHLYKATGEANYLQQSVALANAYLKARVAVRQEQFRDQFSSAFFFWPSFTNKWVDLLELYELTGHRPYLEAARDGARHYAMFTWVSPLIPDSLVTVNQGGKAPMYWYLKSKGHRQMHYPQEQVPAWRLSEIGLTPESSGTSSGHRGIFMANYAPWLLRIGHYTNDDFLRQVAKAAIIGRYRNFPGYHINTARTTAYEQLDFPLHPHQDQSVNSFHYNHILPMATMLLDYLVTDAFVRSGGGIDFPSEFIEGYAYMQNRFYGSRPGRFYQEKEVQLWMPAGLLETESVELNYVCGRKKNQVFLAFMNQSGQEVTSAVQLNASLLAGRDMTSSFWQQQEWGPAAPLRNHAFTLSVPAHGMTVVKLDQAGPRVQVQDQLLAAAPPTGKDLADVEPGRAKAMLLRLGQYGSRAFLYLQDDDDKYAQVRLTYKLPDGQKKTLADKSYPFEFTIQLPAQDPYLLLKLEAVDKKSGKKVKGKWVQLGQAPESPRQAGQEK